MTSRPALKATDLPADVLQLILEQLSSWDDGAHRSSARLVCKAFLAAADRMWSSSLDLSPGCRRLAAAQRHPLALAWPPQQQQRGQWEQQQPLDPALLAFLERVGHRCSTLALGPLPASPSPLLARLPALRSLRLTRCSLAGCGHALRGAAALTELSWECSAREPAPGAALCALAEAPALASLELVLPPAGRADVVADGTLAVVFARLAGSLSSLSLTLGTRARGSELSDAVAKLGHLESLSLTVTSPAELHPGAWAGLPALHTLSIRATSGLHLWAGLAGLPALRHLALAGAVGVGAAAKDLWRCPRLESLSLAYLALERLHDEAEVTLPSLVELTLEGVEYRHVEDAARLGPAILDPEHPLPRRLCTGAPALHRLALLACDLRPGQAPASLARVLLEDVARLVDLRELDLSRSRVEELPASVARLPRLERLTARGCRLRALPPGPYLNSLRHLDLHGAVPLALPQPDGGAVAPALSFEALACELAAARPALCVVV